MGWEGTESATVARRVGMNFYYPDADLNTRVYKNIAKQAERWQLYDPTIPAFSYPTINDDGYPTTIPAGQYAIALVESPVYARSGANMHTGTHRITWDGTGTLAIVNSFAGIQIPVESGDEFANPAGLLYLIIYTTDPADPVRNVEIYEEQYVNDHADLFYPEYIASLEGLNCYRFNNWHLDVVYQGAQFGWDYRTKSTAWSYYSEPRFVMPIEDIVYLCNRLHAHAWIVVPVKALPDYVEGLVAYLHANLDRTAYLEFGNETFIDPPNPSFYSNFWLRAQGLALGLSVNPYEAQCLAAAYYSDIAFKAATDYITANSLNRRKFKFCFSFLRGDNVTIAAQLAFVRDVNPLSDLLDVVSLANYFNVASNVAQMQAVVAACATADDLIDLYQAHIANNLAELQASAALVAGFGLQPALYEWSLFMGVTDPLMLADADYPTFKALLDGMWASPRTPYVITYMLNRIFQWYTEPVNWFCSASRRRDVWWPWGVMEDAGDPDTGKIDAIRGFAMTPTGHTWYMRLNDGGLDYGDKANPFATLTRMLLYAENGDTVLCAGNGVDDFDECLDLNAFWDLVIDQWPGESDAILDYASGVGDCATVRKTEGWGTGTLDIKVPSITCTSASVTAVAVLFGNCNCESQVVRLYSDVDQWDSVAAVNFYNHVHGRIQVYGILGYGGNGPVIESGYQKGGTIEILSPGVMCWGVPPIVFLLGQEGGAFQMNGGECVKIGPWDMFLVIGHLGGTAKFTRLEVFTVFPIGAIQVGLYADSCAPGVTMERVGIYYAGAEADTYGAVLFGSEGVAIRHCGIYAGGVGVLTLGSLGMDLRNNIISMASGGQLLALEDGGNPGHMIDGNVYHVDSFSLYNNGTTYSSLDAWKRASRQDRMSFHGNPGVGDLTGIPPNWRTGRLSICRDAGVICPLVTDTDRDGNRATHIQPQTMCGMGGSAIDIGPYEAFTEGQNFGTSKRYGQPIYGLRKDGSPVVEGWFLG